MEKGWYEDILKTVEEQTNNADQVQEKVLENILKRNAETEYLRKFLHGRTDKQNFKENVPIVTYEDIKSYIDRVINGEPSKILMAESLTEFLESSGTSGGQAKLIPSTDESLEKRASIPILVQAVLRTQIESICNGKAMYLLFAKRELGTGCGIKARMYTTSCFLSSSLQNYISTYCTSPVEMILCLNTKQSMYCQLLIGLLHRDEVFAVGTIFASAFARCIKFLQDYWKEICFNIRTGCLSDWITEPACKNPISSMLSGPNPELAGLLERIFEKKSWEGIVKELWPKAKFIDAIVTGSMSQYISLLDFYGGGLPLVSPAYTSSEACFGINLKPLSKPWDVSYTFLPHMAYFEFLPADKERKAKAQELQSHGVSNEESIEKFQTGKNVEPVDLINVKVGQCYEVVVTTLAGLYRYRVGDVLKVTGFHNKSPQFQFVERQNVALTIDMDKTSEADLWKAITNAKLRLDQHGFVLTTYSSYADTSSTPGRYVLFWELKTKASNDIPKLDAKIMEQCCSIVEESFDFTYKSLRKFEVIAPLELRVVKHGTFDELMDFYVSKGASITQYKTPCCLKSEEAINMLNSGVVGKYFSPKTPS